MKKKGVNKKIVLTGGGTAGHVIPNLALLPFIKGAGYEVVYIGSKKGMEKNIIGNQLPFYAVSTGKLRRYFSFDNFTDFFRLIKGICESLILLKQISPSLIFSKGGFVSVPVVISGWMLKIPVILHESDLTPGLANKICLPFSKLVCFSFPETQRYLPKNKARYTGIPVRQTLLDGNADKGAKLCGFFPHKPVLMVMGGSLGAEAINKAIWQNIEELLNSYQILHICGKGKTNPALRAVKGYFQIEYVYDDLPHFLALCTVVVSRAGANSIFEWLALKKPALLIPLPKKVSRGDQILNAESFRKQGFSLVLQEEKLNFRSLIEQLSELNEKKGELIRAMSNSQVKEGTEKIMNLIKNYSK